LQPGDPLAREELLAVAEVDGRRRAGRIRIAAPLDPDQLAAVAGDRIEEHGRLVWDPERDDLVDRVERRLGRLRLGTVERRPAPGPPRRAPPGCGGRASPPCRGRAPPGRCGPGWRSCGPCWASRGPTCPTAPSGAPWTTGWRRCSPGPPVAPTWNGSTWPPSC